MVSCRECGLRMEPGGSVRLHCSCPLDSAPLCQSCARKALMKTAESYAGAIHCQYCEQGNAQAMIRTVDAAIELEEAIVLEAIGYTKLYHSPWRSKTEGRVDYKKLQICLNKLKLKRDENPVLDHSPEPLSTSRHGPNKNLERKLNEMRREIVGRLLNEPDYSEWRDPLNRIVFAVDPRVEALIAQDNPTSVTLTTEVRESPPKTKKVLSPACSAFSDSEDEDEWTDAGESDVRNCTKVTDTRTGSAEVRAVPGDPAPPTGMGGSSSSSGHMQGAIKQEPVVRASARTVTEQPNFSSSSAFLRDDQNNFCDVDMTTDDSDGAALPCAAVHVSVATLATSDLPTVDLPALPAGRSRGSLVNTPPHSPSPPSLAPPSLTRVSKRRCEENCGEPVAKMGRVAEAITGAEQTPPPPPLPTSNSDVLREEQQVSTQDTQCSLQSLQSLQSQRFTVDPDPVLDRSTAPTSAANGRDYLVAAMSVTASRSSFHPSEASASQAEEDVEAEIASLEQRISAVKEKTVRLQRERDEANDALRAAQEEVQNLRADRDALQKELAAAQAETVKLKQRAESSARDEQALRAEVARLGDAVAHEQAQNQLLKEAAADLKAKVRAADTAMRAEEERCDKALRELQHVRRLKGEAEQVHAAQIASLTAEKNELLASKSGLEKNVVTSTQQIQELQRELTKVQEQRESLKQRAQTYRDRVMELEDECRRKSERIQSLEQFAQNEKARHAKSRADMISEHTEVVRRMERRIEDLDRDLPRATAPAPAPTVVAPAAPSPRLLAENAALWRDVADKNERIRELERQLNEMREQQGQN